MSGYDENPRRFTLSFKTDLNMQTLCLETANKLTGGNVSNFLYGALQDWFTLIYSKADKSDFNNLPGGVRRKILMIRQQRREEVAETHYREWLGLQVTPDEVYERSLQDEAKENDLEWPPRPTLKRVDNIEAEIRRKIQLQIEVSWRESGNGVTTFRELGRVLRTMPAVALWEYVERLRDDGFLVIIEEARNSVKLCRPDALYIVDTLRDK